VNKTDKISIKNNYKPDYNVTFHLENKEIGKLDWNDGVFKFSGKAEKSAKVFFDWVKDHVDKYIEQKLREGMNE